MKSICSAIAEGSYKGCALWQWCEHEPIGDASIEIKEFYQKIKELLERN